jgi:hypothetical protein
MSNILDRAPFTGAILEIAKQSSVKRLCAEMVKSNIIPDIQVVGFSNGISGFIYNSEINEIYKTHEFAVDALINEYIDSIDASSACSVLSDISVELSMTSSDQIDLIKTITAVDYLAQLMYEHGTVYAELTDTQGDTQNTKPFEWCELTKMRQSENWDLLESMLTRQFIGEIEIQAGEDMEITVYETTELKENVTHREKYTVCFYVELSGEHIVVL